MDRADRIGKEVLIVLGIGNDPNPPMGECDSRRLSSTAQGGDHEFDELLSLADITQISFFERISRL
jgi:hypothetical protein